MGTKFDTVDAGYNERYLNEEMNIEVLRIYLIAKELQYDLWAREYAKVEDKKKQERN